MKREGSSDVSRILEAIRTGDADAERLMPLVYDELRRLAGVLLAGERAGHSLQATALVHEAYLRLLGDGRPPWNDRSHFFRAAAQAMRRLLVEHARARNRQKRGGGLERTSLTSSLRSPTAHNPEALLDLNEALVELEQIEPSWVRVVELRYFAGMTVEETAEVLGTSVRTVHRRWTVARAWLHARLGEPQGAGERQTSSAFGA